MNYPLSQKILRARHISPQRKVMLLAWLKSDRSTSDEQKKLEALLDEQDQMLKDYSFEVKQAGNKAIRALNKFEDYGEK